MITEDYVSFETAKLLKEKGFDEATYHDYAPNGARWFQEVLVNHNSQGGVTCPTLQMTMKWLREAHNIYIDVLFLDHDYEGNYGYVINDTTTRDYIATSKNNSYNTPEEAAEDAIKYCLENLI